MKKVLINSKSILSIGLLCSAGIMLLILRVAITGKTLFIFLLWNVFLALLPLLPAYHFRKRIFLKQVWLSIPVFISWLLLFPNAPYLLTDFVHLHDRLQIPIWFDTALLFCFTLSGFLAGILSLHWIHQGLNAVFSKGIAWFCIGLSILLSGYGIYLGRVLRFNSWDIIFNSKKIVLISIMHLQNIEAIAMTITFSIVIGTLYAVFKIIYPQKLKHETFLHQ